MRKQSQSPRTSAEGGARQAADPLTVAQVLLARTWAELGLVSPLQTLEPAEWNREFRAAARTLLGGWFRDAGSRYGWLWESDGDEEQQTRKSFARACSVVERFPAGAEGDVLGRLHEQGLEEARRRGQGQYYSPACIVGFLWDRVGFRPTVGQIAERATPLILDPCTGAGSFLVEAARRIRRAVLPPERQPSGPADREAVVGAIGSILGRLRGYEIDRVGQRLTEIHLLLQMAPLLAVLQREQSGVFPLEMAFPTAILHGDALAQYAAPGEVDYICTNPPYLGEKGHKEFFREVRQRHPYWEAFYQGKMDLLYWFILLGLERLREGGRMGLITTGYWPTADGASVLRREILGRARLVEMIDLGPARVFPDARGQHNLLFMLERCADRERRDGSRPQLVRVGECAPEELVLEPLLDQISSTLEGRTGERSRDGGFLAFPSPVTQGQLGSGPWQCFHDPEVERLLERIRGAGVPLSEVLNEDQGVVSGADRVLKVHLALLPPGTGVRVGEGIFTIRPEELEQLKLTAEEMRFVKPTYRNSLVGRYLLRLGAAAPEYLVYVVPGDGFSSQTAPRLFAHLERFRAVLERKRECGRINARTGRPARFWYELHWGRSAAIFEAEKLITSRRAAHNCFAFGRPGWYENSDLTILTRCSGTHESLKYWLALLNSAVLDFWCGHRGKRKGRQREYYSSPLRQIPLRRIHFAAGDPDADRDGLARLERHLVSSEHDDAEGLLRRAMKDGREGLVHDGLELVVDRILALGADPSSNADYLAPLQSLIDEVVLDLYDIRDADQLSLILTGRGE